MARAEEEATLVRGGLMLAEKVSRLEDTANRLDEIVDMVRKRLDHLTVYHDSAKQPPGLAQDRAEMSETIKRIDDVEDSVTRNIDRLRETLEALQA